MLSLLSDNFSNDKWRTFDFIMQKKMSLFFRLTDFALAEEYPAEKKQNLPQRFTD
jgi:hypothetical protein